MIQILNFETWNRAQVVNITRTITVRIELHPVLLPLLSMLPVFNGLQFIKYSLYGQAKFPSVNSRQ